MFTYSEKIIWSRNNSIFNIIAGSNLPQKTINTVTDKMFAGHPYFFVFDKFSLAHLFEDSGPTIYNSFLDDLENILALPKGYNHFLLNTDIETFDINFYFN